MLSVADNELLTRTGRGTPMGELYRRFWFPALLSRELPERGGPPVKVQLLGEKLVAFRGKEGKVGLMDARCPHRHANLFWGRNEEDGIRCVYHGWKFAMDGQCLEMPAEPPDSTFKNRVRVVAYDTHEAGGIIWAYLGPKDVKPEFPQFEWTLLPDDHSYASKRLQRCNWFQNVEGELDTAHVQFLHRDFNPGNRENLKHMLAGGHPEYSISETPVGMLAIARRSMPEAHYYWRITPFLMPAFTLVPTGPDERNFFTAAVPIDDENMWGFTVSWRHDRPFDDEDWDNALSGKSLHVNVDPKTFLPLANAENDFLIDREMQRTTNYTGIVGVRVQDLPVQEDQGGPICQRNEEHLGTTDRAIVAARRLMLRTAKQLAAGTEPEQPRNHEAFRMRSVAYLAPESEPWQDLFTRYQPEGAPIAALGSTSA
jgi:phthalate 4,5-dioxygenase oxygenase subunit